MKKASLISVLFMLVVFLFSQEKPPEITNDFASILAGDTISVNVLSNDWGMEGHTIKIFLAWNTDGGEISFSDSILNYYSYYYFAGLDSVRYIVRDMDNGLDSESGYLYIDVSNVGRSHLNVNNISAVINAFGFQYNTLPDWDTEFEVPAGSGANTIFLFTLWMGGLDENEELHLSAERYRQVGADYYVGPVGDYYENQQMIDWNKAWKINRQELEYHKQNWLTPDYEPIENIKNWPAHGDIQKGQNYYLAPFIDYDEDGNYDPFSGDAPAIRGDQGIFMIYNDDLGEHGESGGQKIGVEIQTTAYAFDCPHDSVFNNSVFFHYNLINRSDTAYHNFFISSFVDFDLGNPWDDFVGCDTLLNSFFAYNGDNYDENSILWNPDTTFGYLDYPPAQGFTYLNHGMSSFLSLLSFGGATSDPYYLEEYYNIMNGLWKDSTSITYGGNGYGGDMPVKYQYPGNPNNPLEWSEVSAENEPDDRKGIGTTGPYNFNPGDTIQLDLAFVFARDYEGDYLSSVSLLKERIETLRWYYENDSTPCGLTWLGVSEKSKQEQLITLYPNPCSNYLEWTSGNNLNEEFKFEVIDLYGKEVLSGFGKSKTNRINTSNLKNGIYILKFENKKSFTNLKFIKR